MTELIIFGLVIFSAGYIVLHLRKIMTKGETALKCRSCPLLLNREK